VLLFGQLAFVQHSDLLRRHRQISHTLGEHGYTPGELLEVMRTLKGIIYRTLTPHAADHKLAT